MTLKPKKWLKWPRKLKNYLNTLRTLKMTVFLSYSVVPLLFSHIWQFHHYIRQYPHHIWLYFCYIWWYRYSFLTFNSSNVALGRTKSHMIILLLYSIVLLFFSKKKTIVLLFFSHIRQFQFHIYFYWFITILVIIKMLTMNFPKIVINLEINKNTWKLRISKNSPKNI